MTVGRTLYLQVLLAMVIGIALGQFAPETAQAMHPLADGFIKLIKLFVGPIIFVSIVHGVASLPSMNEAGRIGAKALAYFLAMSAVSLLLGLIVANLFAPGVGLHVKAGALSNAASQPAIPHASSLSEFLLHIIPSSIIEPFATTNILQILFLALMVAMALLAMRPHGDPLLRGIDTLSKLLFTMMGYVMRLAPLAAFGAMATTVGTYGLSSLLPLGKLLACFYLTCALFIVVGLGLMLRSINISLGSILRTLREEIFVTFATSSSESVLPRLLIKLEKMGCAPSVVSLAVPTGYSFNLDGTAIRDARRDDADVQRRCGRYWCRVRYSGRDALKHGPHPDYCADTYSRSGSFYVGRTCGNECHWQCRSHARYFALGKSAGSHKIAGGPSQ
jgi:aerobic C4-dicarboxylate transport protein